MEFNSDYIRALKNLKADKLENLGDLEKRALAELKHWADKAKSNSYSPYSNFPVGCALISDSAKIYTGCNVENCVYGETICAERTAAVKAISCGENKFAICGITSNIADSSCPPCGSCRQVLREFGKDLIVFGFPSDFSTFKRWTMDELLPDSFGPESLSKAR